MHAIARVIVHVIAREIAHVIAREIAHVIAGVIARVILREVAGSMVPTMRHGRGYCDSRSAQNDSGLES